MRIQQQGYANDATSSTGTEEVFSSVMNDATPRDASPRGLAPRDSRLSVSIPARHTQVRSQLWGVRLAISRSNRSMVSQFGFAAEVARASDEPRPHGHGRRGLQINGECPQIAARMLERDLPMVDQQQLSGILGFLLIFQVSAEARDKFKLMGSGSSDAPARCRTQVSSRPKWCT